MIERKSNSLMEFYDRSNEVDVLTLLETLKVEWRKLTAFVLIGTLLAVVLALSLPKGYRSEAFVSSPTAGDTEIINSGSADGISSNMLLFQFYTEFLSKDNVKLYALKNDLIKEIDQNSTSEVLSEEQQKALMDFWSRFDAKFTDMFEVGPGENEYFLKLTHSSDNEDYSVRLLNDYIGFINKLLLEKLVAENEIVKNQRIARLNTRVLLLKESEKFTRELEVERLGNHNNLKIKQLEIQKEEFIALGEKERMSKLAEAKEAYVIANNLGIKKSAYLGDMQIKGENEEGGTKINVNLIDGNQSQLYMMGTDYLSVLIDILTDKTGDSLFSEQIHELEKQISETRKDPELSHLEERQIGDPYIKELPSLISEIEFLKSKTLNTENVQLVSIIQRAYLTGYPIKPPRKLIVVTGLLISAIFGAVIVLISAELKQRKGSQES